MRILWRYILKEHIGPFVFSMCVITLLFILNLVFKDLSRILSKGLGLGVVLEFFALQLAWIIAMAGPMSVLVATVMAFGRLSGDQEITALKAGGIGVPSMMMPVLLAAALLTLFMIWFNNNVLPDVNHRARLLATDIYRKRPTLNIEAGVIFRDLPDYTMRVQNIVQIADTAFVDSIFIDDNRSPNSSKVIFADHGAIWFDSQAEMLLLTLYDGEMHELDLLKMEQYRKLSFPKQIISIPVSDMALQRSQSEARGDREKSASMMLAEITENQKEVERYRRQLSVLIKEHLARYLNFSAADSGATPEKRGPWSLERLTTEHARLQQQTSGQATTISHLERKNSSLMVEVHKKYSIPVACIVFVLIGAPLGITARRGSLAMAGGISFSFFLLYWAALIGGEELADKQIISPFSAMWTANILVGIAGLYMVFHATFETLPLRLLIRKMTTPSTRVHPEK